MSLTWWLRQARALAGPAGPVAGRVMLERDGDVRARRLAQRAIDTGRQRVRPSRPRMRALTLRPGGRLVWRSVPAPAPPGPLAAVVRPIAIATCDMDRPMMLGATPFVTPLAFGHECVAEVLAVGCDVEHVRPGQRVVVPFEISCGACAACAAGRTANCLKVPPISMYGFGLAGGHWGGAVADELAVPFADGMLVPLPDGLAPAAAASVADNVSDGYRHVAPYLPGLLRQDADARTVIVGSVSRATLFTGSVALYTALVAKALGAHDVVLIDARAEIRRQATELQIRSLSPREARGCPPAPLVAEVSGDPAGLRLAITLTAPDGVCSSAGSLHATTKLPTMLMFGRNVTVTVARSHARAVIPGVLELMSSGALRPELVTTLVAPVDDAREALTEHMRGRSTKTILTV